MKVTLEINDNDADRILELLKPFAKVSGVRKGAKLKIKKDIKEWVERNLVADPEASESLEEIYACMPSYYGAKQELAVAINHVFSGIVVRKKVWGPKLKDSPKKKQKRIWQGIRLR